MTKDLINDLLIAGELGCFSVDMHWDRQKFCTPFLDLIMNECDY